MEISTFVVLGLIAVALIYGVLIYNNLVTLKHAVSKAWANIDVLLKQRHDELPKLVAVCERYMKHEAETLQKVTEARAMSAGAKTLDAKAEAEGFLSEALKSLFAVTENYPELRADAQFGKLQARVTTLENEISDRREFFNDSVNIYNIRIEQFPDLIVARLFQFVRRSLWKIRPGDREDVKIAFSE